MRSLLLLFVLLCPIVVVSQTTLRGVVTDGRDAVVGAAVVVENTSVGSATDTKGEFDFEYEAGKTMRIKKKKSRSNFKQ